MIRIEGMLFRIFHQNWFLIALVLALWLGWQFCDALRNLPAANWLTDSVIFVVMFLMAWTLETSAIVRTIRNPMPAFLASGINLGLVPPIAFAFSLMFDKDLAVGLIVLGAVPCTLASASVWTRRAGGNDAAALMTTVITNGLCFVFTPMWIFLLCGRATSDYSFLDLVFKLLLIVLLPMALAQLCRLAKPIGSWATRNKVPLGVICQCGILITVLTGSVAMGLKMQNAQEVVSVAVISGLFVVTIVIHVGVLVLGVLLSRLLNLDRANQIAVGFSGSQKTLMVGLAICLQLDVSILPMVIYHSIQLVADTPIADWFRKSGPNDASL